MDTHEERLDEEEYWVAEKLAEFRHKYGLDAETVPERWKPWEWSWRLARALDQLSDQLVGFVGSGFEALSSDFEQEVNRLGSQELVSDLCPKRRELARAFAKVLADANRTEDQDREPVGPRDDDLLPCIQFLEHLTRLKLGFKAIHWDFQRLLQVASLGVRVRSEAGRAYLHQAIKRCVANPDDAMIAVPCRSVLEVELKHRIGKEAVMTYFSLKSSKPTWEPSLAKYLQYAFETDRLPKRVQEAAATVRTRGNSTVHTLPNLYEPSESLAALGLVLKAL